MKKVLYVTRPMVPPWHEGSKNLVWHLASSLKRFEPHLLTMPLGSYPKTMNNIKWHPVYSQQTLTLLQKGRLLRFLYSSRLQKVDLLHNYFVPSLMTSRLLSFSQRKHQLPIVQTVPSLPQVELTTQQAKQLFYGDAVVVYSSDSAEKLKKLGVNQVVQINVGVRFEKIEQAQRNDQLRKSLGCEEDSVMILFSGEYTRLGAIDRLRQIIPAVLDQSAKAHFVIACRLLLPTDLPIKQQLQADIKKWGLADRVHFVGEVDDFSTLLQSSDIFIFPVSDMKGKIETPLTLIESMAAKLPVMTTDIYPLSKMFPKDLRVLFSKSNDLFISELVNLIQNPEQRQAIGEAGYRFVKPRYGMAKMVASYEEIYGKLF